MLWQVTHMNVQHLQNDFKIAINLTAQSVSPLACQAATAALLDIGRPMHEQSPCK